MKITSKIMIPSILLLSVCYFNDTSALDYQSSTNVQFTFNPTISVSVSGDLNIDELVPGSSKDSNIIDVNVSTNNVSGYNLSATVGNTTHSNPSYNTTNLTHTNNTNTFTSLSTTDNISSMDNIDVSSNGKWGYSYSTNNGTNWSNYSGLPLYTSTSTTLKQTYNAANDTIKFKIGAKASNTQVTGDYTNIINFIAVANQSPVSFYDAFSAAGKTQYNGYYKMQDMTSTICNNVQIEGDDSAIDLIDIRDNEVYKVAKLKDNRCWMLDNLRLGSNDNAVNLTPSDTNIIEAYTLPQGITSEFQSYTTAQLNVFYKNNTATSYGIGSGKIGTYYNYCAATAGTYCYDHSNTGNALYDVCPINWHLPSIRNSDGYLALCKILNNNTACSNGMVMDASMPNSIQYSLSLPLSGRFDSSSQLYLNQIGYYWSSTNVSKTTMFAFSIQANNSIYPIDDFVNNHGFNIRCIAQ